jgi:hypothetical protein
MDAFIPRDEGVFKIGGEIVQTQDVTRSAVGKRGLRATVIAAAVLDA